MNIADITIRSAELFAAAARGDVEAVTALLAGGADPNFRDVLSGMTALHEAAVNGFDGIASVLIRNGADVNSCNNDTFSSPLGVALLAGRHEMVRLLIENEADLSKEEVESGLVEEARSFGRGNDVDLIRNRTTERCRESGKSDLEGGRVRTV